MKTILIFSESGYLVKEFLKSLNGSFKIKVFEISCFIIDVNIKNN